MTTPDVIFVVMRVAHITFGLLWCLLCAYIFPVRSRIKYTRLLGHSVAQISQFFSYIIDKTVDSNVVDQGIEATTKELRNNYQTMRGLLKDSKSEMVTAWQGFRTFSNSLQRTQTAYFALLDLHLELQKGFSPLFQSRVVSVLAVDLCALPPIIERSAKSISNAISNTSFGLDEIHGSLMDALGALDESYFQLRRDLFAQKSLSTLYPEMRNFNTFLYILRLFLREWLVLEHDIRSAFGLLPVIDSVIPAYATINMDGLVNTPRESPSDRREIKLSESGNIIPDPNADLDADHISKKIFADALNDRLSKLKRSNK